MAFLECEVSERSSAETYFVNRTPPLHNNTHTYTSTQTPHYENIHLFPQKHHTNTSSPPASTQASIQSLYKTPQQTIQKHTLLTNFTTKFTTILGVGFRNHWFHTDALACRYTNTSQNHSNLSVNIQPHRRQVHKNID